MMRHKKIVSVHMRVHESTALQLQKLKRFQMETYDEVIKRLINFYAKNGGDGHGDDE